MKAINIKKNQMNASMSRGNRPIDLSNRQPCWYANLECKDGKEKAKWTIGLKRPGEDRYECSFKVSKAGDVNDEVFWDYISSSAFAIKLLDLFKDNGKSAIDEWVKNGCPGAEEE